MLSDGDILFNNYLARHDDSFKPCLTALRALILSLVPDAIESFSYQVHCFRHVYMLVGIGANKDFCSLHTMSPSLVKKMKKELAACKISGATIHFRPGELLPEEIISKIILARKHENELLAADRNKKK